MPTTNDVRQPLPAFIGGSGVYALNACGEVVAHHIPTPFQDSASLVYQYAGAPHGCLFLPRHGAQHQLAPHQINYRANIWALREAGAICIVAFNAVGGIGDNLQPGTLCLPDQLIDYTWGREGTFHTSDAPTNLASLHVDFTEPYSAELRAAVLMAAQDAKLSLITDGVYGCTQGPRLETAAEIRRMQRDGCTIVGMTGMPEAVLARELGLPYCSIALVVNRAAGLEADALKLDEIERHSREGAAKLEQLALALLPRLEKFGTTRN